MANFLQDKTVQYVCSCGVLNPLSKLFFCRHCPNLKCAFCVCHEVDSHFCSNCLENIPSTEARHKKNCCANCFDCPCCQHSLSARATTVVVPKKAEETSISSPKEEEDSLKSVSSSVSTPSMAGVVGSGSGSGSGSNKTQTKKMYYLSCLGCRWTSRDVGIPDQNVATGAWPDQECTYQTRFTSLSEYYQAIVQQDRLERQEFLKRKMPKTHKFPSLTDRTGLTVSIIRRQMGWPDKSLQKIKPAQITPSEAVESFDDLPDSIFTQPIDLKSVTTVKQRHNQPAEQPFSIHKLYPQRRRMWVKRSLRCRQCEHSVIKPEYHPTSIKYRIHLFASYQVPNIRFLQCPKPLRPSTICSVVLKLTNPTVHDMNVTFKQLPSISEELQLLMDFKELHILKESSTTNSLAPDSLKSLTTTTSPNLLNTSNCTNSSSLGRQSVLCEEPRLMKRPANCTFLNDDMKFMLNMRDDAKEFEEEFQTENDDTPLIIWRKSNKIAIRVEFTPDKGLKVGEDVVLGFNMHYTYVNTMGNATERRERGDPIKQDMNCYVYIKVGQIAPE